MIYAHDPTPIPPDFFRVFLL